MSDIDTLRLRPHSTKLWLSIFQPDTALACQVNDPTITHEAYLIPFDNVTEGSGAQVGSGHTVLVGTAPGKWDVGRVRAKWATTDTLKVAENSHINWQDDLYIKVIMFKEIWPKFARYVISGETVTWYKDYDVPMGTRNNDMGTIICMGAHYAGFKGDQVYFTSEDTVNVKGEGLTYDWNFPGGNPSSSTAAVPGNVTYNTPGHYPVVLQVTSTTTSAVDTAWRHISIYDRPGEGSNVPILQWELGRLQGSRGEGGYSADITVHEDIDIVDGALVIIFADDRYGDTEGSIGGDVQGREKIVFVGYVNEGSIQYDYQTSQVDFEVVSPTQIMRLKEGSNLSLDSVKTTPVSWDQIPDMNVTRALYHYLQWHSTVMLATDFKYIGTDYKFQYLETNPTSLYDTLHSFAQSALIGEVVCDRHGIIYLEQTVPALSNPLSDIPTNMELLRQDWIGEPKVHEVIYGELGYIEMGGVAWSGANTGTSTAYLASAPGNTPGYSGKFEDHQGLILTSQEHLNTLAGDVFAYRNARYPSVLLELSGNYRNIDIAPLKQMKLTINETDTKQGIVFNSKPFITQSMEWKYSPTEETFLPIIDLHEITEGFAGKTQIIPPPPKVNIPDPPDPPEIPIFPPIGTPVFPPVTIPEIPESVTGCCYNPDSPPNVVSLNVRGILDSTASEGDRILKGYSPGMSLRPVSSSYSSLVVVDGCFEQSSDAGETWDVWTDNDGWEIYAFSEFGVRRITADMSLVDGARCEYRGGYFTQGACIGLGSGGGMAATIDASPGYQSGTIYSYDMGGIWGVQSISGGGNFTITNTDGVFDVPSYLEVDTGGGAAGWGQVIYDLGELYFISTLQIYIAFYKYWYAYGSTNNQDWIILDSQYNLDQGPWQIRTPDPDASYRYIRFTSYHLGGWNYQNYKIRWFAIEGYNAGTQKRITVNDIIVYNICTAT